MTVESLALVLPLLGGARLLSKPLTKHDELEIGALGNSDGRRQTSSPASGLAAISCRSMASLVRLPSMWPRSSSPHRNEIGKTVVADIYASRIEEPLFWSWGSRGQLRWPPGLRPPDRSPDEYHQVARALLQALKSLQPRGAAGFGLRKGQLDIKSQRPLTPQSGRSKLDFCGHSAKRITLADADGGTDFCRRAWGNRAAYRPPATRPADGF